MGCTLDWRTSDTVPVAALTGHQGSGMVSSIARADALAAIPPGVGEIAAGTIVEIVEFREA